MHPPPEQSSISGLTPCLPDNAFPAAVHAISLSLPLFWHPGAPHPVPSGRFTPTFTPGKQPKPVILPACSHPHILCLPAGADPAALLTSSLSLPVFRHPGIPQLPYTSHFFLPAGAPTADDADGPAGDAAHGLDGPSSAVGPTHAGRSGCRIQHAHPGGGCSGHAEHVRPSEPAAAAAAHAVLGRWVLPPPRLTA